MAKFLEGLNTARKTIVIFLLLAIAIWIWRKWDQIPSVSSWFAAKPVLIDETPLIISEIKSIAELHTARLYCEVITDSTVINTSQAIIQALQHTLITGPLIYSGMGSSKKLVIVAKGQVIAGIDLNSLTEESIRVSGDSAFLKLPSAQIIEVISNPSDFEVFMEEGEWTSTETAAVKQKAILKMTEEAHRLGLLKKANEKATILMKNFLLTSGFSYADVQLIE
jgi:hypothetical protein